MILQNFINNLFNVVICIEIYFIFRDFFASISNKRSSRSPKKKDNHLSLIKETEWQNTNLVVDVCRFFLFVPLSTCKEDVVGVVKSRSTRYRSSDGYTLAKSKVYPFVLTCCVPMTMMEYCQWTSPTFHIIIILFGWDDQILIRWNEW